jgi:hypothetical protein
LDSQGYYIAEAARSEYGCSDNWSGGGGGGGSSGTTCGGNPCGENIISCCSWQGSDVCVNPDGSCPDQGNQCGSNYCNVGETCCSGNICNVNSDCSDSGGETHDCSYLSNGYWDSVSQSCQSSGTTECEPGYSWDSTMSQCVSSDSNAGGGETHDCSYLSNGYWDSVSQSCQSSGTTECDPGYTWDSNMGSCVSSDSNMGGDCGWLNGGYWDSSSMQCLCYSQYVNDGNNNCVPYDSGSGGGEHYMEPYGRRLKYLRGRT